MLCQARQNRNHGFSGTRAEGRKRIGGNHSQPGSSLAN
jgi:hypothetical protein